MEEKLSKIAKETCVSFIMEAKHAVLSSAMGLIKNGI